MNQDEILKLEEPNVSIIDDEYSLLELEYWKSRIDKANAIQSHSGGEYDTIYSCPKCSRKYSVQAEEVLDTLMCSCGFKGKI